MIVIAVALAVLGIGALAARHLLTLATVRGSSMSPTFTDGERVLAIRARCRVGDVIVFRVGDGGVAGDPLYRIKRVAAIAGDPAPSWLPTEVCAERTVPPGHVVVLGDNARSQDSRHLGYIPVAAVSGRVVPFRVNAGEGKVSL